jgi:hypothetical protein
MKVIKLGQLERWMAASGPLFEMKMRKKSTKDRLAVVALRAQYLMAYIMLRALGTMREMDYDEYLEEFREIVDLCAELESHCGPSKLNKGDGESEVYVFDMQSVMPLDFIARKCRDPILRRRAIRLLKARPRRELFWDSVTAARVCEWIVEIEEEGLVDGLVKEENRARGIALGPEHRGVATGPEVESDDEVKSVKVWCTLGTGEKREGIVVW